MTYLTIFFFLIYKGENSTEKKKKKTYAPLIVPLTQPLFFFETHQIITDSIYFISKKPIFFFYLEGFASVSAAGVVVLFADEAWFAAICQAGIPARAPLLFNVAERREDKPSVAVTGVEGRELV